MMEAPSNTTSLMEMGNFSEDSCNDGGLFVCLERQIPIAVTLSLISIVTVCGNIFVMIAYTTDNRIRSTVANTFILNLSICDLIIGAVSIPLNSIWVVIGWWPFGKILCQIWLVLDYTCTNVTVLTIIFISLDRHWLLTKKLAYGTFQTHRQATIMCVTVWFIYTVFYSLVTFGWGPLFGDENVDYSEDCELEPFENGPFVGFQLAVEFLIPLLVIIYLNTKVYMNIKQRSKGHFRSACPSHESSHASSRDAALHPGPFRQDSTAEREQNTHFTDHSDVKDKGKTEPMQLDSQEYHCNAGYDIQLDEISTIFNSDQRLPPIRTAQVIGRERVIENEEASSPCNHAVKHPTTNLSAHPPQARRRARELQRHRKAAVTLSVIVGVFVTTWLPFHVSSILVAFCEDCISDLTWEIVNYLLWCNSTLNPFLYALLVVRFRQNFSRYLGLHLCTKRR
ncbi:muscarinic acetylcholine receptor M2-like [Asterias amurensis]|uniref:muscarinic acetylcholine receptor M2-like n=1 Tax=Asterias amurensis TaxID=7602 RepID=UPI003AB60D5C